MTAPSRPGEPPGTRQMLADLCAERLTAPDACRWAASALEAGFDAPSLRILAGMSLDRRSSFFEVRPVLDRALSELDLPSSASRDEILRAYARLLAEELLAGVRPVDATLEVMHDAVVAPLKHAEDLMGWCYPRDGLNPAPDGTFEPVSGPELERATRLFAARWLAAQPSADRQSSLGAAAMISAAEALERLRAGNLRFRTNTGDRARLTSQERRADLTTQQRPFAIVLGCSDSRVPAEIVFDQGLGDLFVIRVAGNIVAPSQIGSVEFAASRFGTRLVVVLGHSHCGAVQATIEELRQPATHQSRNLRSIVDRVRPVVEPLLQTELTHDVDALLRHAVRANVSASANQLRHGSEILEQLIRDDALLVVGAEYSLETGAVEVFDGVEPG
jgi:carbonic anhydrase